MITQMHLFYRRDCVYYVEGLQSSNQCALAQNDNTTTISLFINKGNA